MPRVTITQPRSDCLIIERGAQWSALVPVALVSLGLGGAFWLARPFEGWSLLLTIVSAVLLPVLAVAGARAVRPRTATLVRTQGRLLLDGEPLELARVELRVRSWPFSKQPRGYELSLWMLTLTGPEDLPLGRFPTLLAASASAGQCEEFVQKANASEPHRA
jgi:hypothetical protein